jgi:hypothetical protein
MFQKRLCLSGISGMIHPGAVQLGGGDVRACITTKNKEMQRMAKEQIKAMDAALSNNGRRSFLKGLLIGGAAVAAMPLLKSQALAQDDNAPKKKKKKADNT